MGSRPHAAQLSQTIVACATELGFHRAGIARLASGAALQRYQAWLDTGMHGSMAYMASPSHRAARADLEKVMAGARSVIAVAMAHDAKTVPVQALTRGGSRGVVARYAQRPDYHFVIKERLSQLADRISELVGRPVLSRPCVDSAPVLERDIAARAGLGFIGKNTMLIAPGVGSYILLGELLVDIELEPTDGDEDARRCGSCRACLDACPTGAFQDPFVLDARLCISYLTIEHRGSIPRHLRRAIGTRIFGCDVCQDVCPFNSAAPHRIEPDAELATLGVDIAHPLLIDILQMGSARWRRFVGNTPLRRAGRAGLVRNACVALGNAGDPAAVPALTERLAADPSGLVRGHAAWALGQLGAGEALRSARPSEGDPSVIEEIDWALDQLRPAADG